MKDLSISEFDKMRQTISNPGTSLLRNPFGSRACYFYGLFYPFADNATIECAQRLMMQVTQDGNEAWVFFGKENTSVNVVEEGLSDLLVSNTLDSDGLYDINVFLPKTDNAFCISQEESIVLSTLDFTSICDEQRLLKDEVLSSANDSVSSIFEHVYLLKYISNGRVNYTF